MATLTARPSTELLFPSVSKPGWYHAIEVLLDGNFVRVFPDAGQLGILFPVTEPEAFLELIREIPSVRA